MIFSVVVIVSGMFCRAVIVKVIISPTFILLKHAAHWSKTAGSPEVTEGMKDRQQRLYLHVKCGSESVLCELVCSYVVFYAEQRRAFVTASVSWSRFTCVIFFVFISQSWNKDTLSCTQETQRLLPLLDLLYPVKTDQTVRIDKLILILLGNYNNTCMFKDTFCFVAYSFEF